MNSQIEYCCHNGTYAVNQMLLDSEFDVDVRFCLDRCDECYRSSFLVVDGDPVVDSSHERILNRIRKSHSSENE